ncbi:endosome-associated-trafficking regulator 1 isoform X2 [Cuculus canorus]|uniref:endosome-associated-trafficking regulator 1 isoform X2 n=1 Tax=Cuculus canorus TaxID=55661 RepID=UPI0023AB4EF2|nr:endosome-associated-trafficking regulator 1 isoform X2 [Cuculus canorus]
MAAGEGAALPAGPAEPNPFSFHEFVRSRSGEEAGGTRQAARPSPALGPVQFPVPSGEVEEEEEEEEWSGSYQPSAVEQAYLGPTGSLAAPLGLPAPRQLSYEELKEENASLRSKINKLQIFSETQADKLRQLEKKLEENKIKEEKEAQDLEAMVQHVEQNLQLMTVQLNNYKTENEALRSGQMASLAVVKQNADLALQNLLTVLTTSRSSIKQLLSGAESLQLVADLLKSIDRISEVSEDGQ